LDKLKSLYLADTLIGEEKIKLLHNLAYYEREDFSIALRYVEESINYAEKLNSNLYLSKSYIQLGNVYQSLEDYRLSLQAFFKAEEYAKTVNSLRDLAVIYFSIGNSFSEIGNHDNADDYFNKSMEIYEKEDILIEDSDYDNYGTALFNLGNVYLKRNNYLWAQKHFEDAEKVFRKTNFQEGIYYVIGNLGQLYYKLGNHDEAEKNLKLSIEKLLEMEDHYPASEYLACLAKLKMDKNDYALAKEYANQSLNSAEKIDHKIQFSETSFILFQLDTLIAF
jgi:tetratricopeptide (TPR) repeat protein